MVASGDEPAPAEPAPAESEAAPVEAAAAAEPAAKPKPATGASGGRPSVAEMLAMARGEKRWWRKESRTRSRLQRSPPPQPSLPRKNLQPPRRGLRSRAIPRVFLAAARKANKPGPMSKAEAAAKAKADPTAKTKPKIVVPPMPEKPAYAKPKEGRQEEGQGRAPIEERRSFLLDRLLVAGRLSPLVVESRGTEISSSPTFVANHQASSRLGFPDAYPAGQVQTKFKAQFGVWVANAEYNGQQQIYALKSVCTHLGCTPSWLDAEQKYKCPCHGSGFYKDGINFEGPAPRPLERCAIRIADDGQIEIDKSRTFQEEMGQWEDPASYVSV